MMPNSKSNASFKQSTTKSIIAVARRRYVLILGLTAVAMFAFFVLALFLCLLLIVLPPLTRNTLHLAPTLFLYPVLPLVLTGAFLTYIFWNHLFRIKEVSALEQIVHARSCEVTAEFDGAWPTRVPLIKIAASAISADAAPDEERLFTARGKGFKTIAANGSTQVMLFLGPTTTQPLALQKENIILSLTETDPTALSKIHRRKLNQCIVSMALALSLVAPLIWRPFEVAWLILLPQFIQDGLVESQTSEQVRSSAADVSSHFEADDSRHLFCTMALATKLLEKGRYQEAEECVVSAADRRIAALRKKGITRDPYVTMALIHAANTRVFQGDFASAAQLMQKARSWLPEKDPGLIAVKLLPGISMDVSQVVAAPQVTLFEARHMYAAERFPESIQLYQRCLAEIPDSKKYAGLTASAWEELGLVHFELGQTKTALADFRKATSALPDEECKDSKSFHLRGHGWLELAAASATDFEAARQDMKNALKIVKAEESNQSFPEAIIEAETSQMYVEQGDTETARTKLDACMQRWKKAKGTQWVSYAVLLIAHANLLDSDSQALSDLDQAIKICSGKPNAVGELALAATQAANIYRKQNNLPKAMEMNQLAIDSYQTKPGLYAWQLAATLVSSAKMSEQMRDEPHAEQFYRDAVATCKLAHYICGPSREAAVALNACSKFLDQKGEQKTSSTFKKLAGIKEKQLHMSAFYPLAESK